VGLEYVAYFASLVCVAIMCLVLASRIWRRRPAPGTAPLSILMLGMAWWAGAQAASIYSSPDVAIMVRCEKAMYLGIVTVPGACLAFVVAYAGEYRRGIRRAWPLLVVVPTITYALMVTNERHRLIWQKVWLVQQGAYGALAVVHGRGFWVYAIYSYCLLFLSLGMLVRLWVHARQVYRKQLAIVIVACVVPWGGNALYLLGVQSVAALDLTPLSFGVTAIVLVQGLHKWRFLDLKPIARDVVIENMGDAMIVLDDQCRIIDVNPAADMFLGCPAKGVLAKRLGETLPALADFMAGSAVKAGGHLLRVEHVRGQPRDCEIEVCSTPKGPGVPAGRVITAHEVSERESERVERDLQSGAVSGLPGAPWRPARGDGRPRNAPGCQSGVETHQVAVSVADRQNGRAHQASCWVRGGRASGAHERAEQHAVSAILCIEGGDLVLPGADERAAQWPGHALGVISIVNETGP